MLSKSQIKYIQSLHQKKFRTLTGAYIAEGPKIVEEALVQIPGQVEYLLGSPGWIAGHAAVLGRIPPEKILPVIPSELEKVSALTTPNEVLAVLFKPAGPVELALPGTAWCLALDGIRDPGNLGTIIRIADWFGVTHLLCSEECAELYNPKVIQASMGSFLRVQARYTGLVDALSGQGRPVYAATLAGEPVTGLRDAPPGIVLIGSESKGISPALLALATREVTIPRIGSAESLNAAVATGILLSHFCGVAAKR
jgi:TrmH family RNA methyltransferase